MADQVPISGLPAVSSTQAADLFATVQAGVTSKQTATQVLAFAQSNIQITESQVTNLTTDLAAKLVKTANLSDVANAGTAATNLGLGTGNSPTFVGATYSGLTASQVVVTTGAKALASYPYAVGATPSTLCQRDSEGNSIFNNSVSASTVVASAGGSITLTSASTRIQKVTGTDPFTFAFPDATTLTDGWQFAIDNNSTGTTTCNNAVSGLITTVLSGNYIIFTCTSTSSAAGTWDYHSMLPINGVLGSSGVTATYSGGAINITATAPLASIAGLTTVANEMIYTTAADTYAVTPVGALGLSLLNSADIAAAQSTLALVPGTNVQAYNAALASIAGLTTVADEMIYTTAANTYAVNSITSFTRGLFSNTTGPTWLNDLGVIFGATEIWAGGASSHTFTDASLTGLSSSFAVSANFLTRTNVTPILDVTPGTNQLTVVFSGDPGANTQLQFIAISKI